MNTRDRVRVLAISGSLRRASSNSALIEAVARLSLDTADVSIYRELETLPPFNPDLEGGPAPAPVARFRAALQECDAVLISSPEYAHGVPGVLKNALDWVVGSGEFVDKPVALINTSARATHAWHRSRRRCRSCRRASCSMRRLRFRLAAEHWTRTASSGMPHLPAL